MADAKDIQDELKREYVVLSGRNSVLGFQTFFYKGAMKHPAAKTLGILLIAIRSIYWGDHGLRFEYHDCVIPYVFEKNRLSSVSVVGYQLYPISRYQ